VRGRPLRATLPGLMVAAACAALPGCGATSGSIYEARDPGMPPLSRTDLPPTYLTPRSQRYRIAVLSFVDQTGRGRNVSEPVADILTTALFETGRFDLVDRRELKSGERAAREAESRRARAAEAGAAPSTEAAEDYAWVGDDVDGILQGYVTAIQTDARGSGRFEADYRIVNPDTGLVVISDSARVRFQSDPSGRSVGIVRTDVARLARTIAASFTDPDVLARRGVVVTEVHLVNDDAQITLNAGALGEAIRQGYAGFVVEEDEESHVERYLAKFVVVNVFPEASVGMIVPHCNRVTPCASEPDARVSPLEQVRGLRIGSSVRLK